MNKKIGYIEKDGVTYVSVWKKRLIPTHSKR